MEFSDEAYEGLIGLEARTLALPCRSQLVVTGRNLSRLSSHSFCLDMELREDESSTNGALRSLEHTGTIAVLDREDTGTTEKIAPPSQRRRDCQRRSRGFVGERGGEEHLGGSGGSGGMTGTKASSRTRLHGGGGRSGRGLRHDGGLVTIITMERSRAASKGGGGEIGMAGAKEIHQKRRLGKRARESFSLGHLQLGSSLVTPRINVTEMALCPPETKLRREILKLDFVARAADSSPSVAYTDKTLIPDDEFTLAKV
ncbi:hypothetical protein Bca4012_083493 [Brassica carinata]